VILPKCHSFTFLQECFVFSQHKLKVYCVNLTQKFPLPLLTCALLLTGSICDRHVIVEICILPKI